jgi:hypothetical protein
LDQAFVIFFHVQKVGAFFVMASMYLGIVYELFHVFWKLHEEAGSVG